MSMKKLDVVLIQADIAWEDDKKNLAYFDKKISALENVDLVILPEMFTSGFSMSPRSIAQSMSGSSVNWMRETSVRKNVDILGSLVIEENEKYYNRLVWVKPNGDIFTYDKKHLFSFSGEHEQYTAGSEKLVVDINGWKVSTFICFDLRFPVWSRNNEKAYDLAIYIASWPARRAEHWKALLKARAIENQSFVIGLNRVGVDGNGIAYSGDSTVIDSLGVVRYLSSCDETVHRHALDKAHLNEVRENFPFLKEADPFELVL